MQYIFSIFFEKSICSSVKLDFCEVLCYNFGYSFITQCVEQGSRSGKSIARESCRGLRAVCCVPCLKFPCECCGELRVVTAGKLPLQSCKVFHRAAVQWWKIWVVPRNFRPIYRLCDVWGFFYAVERNKGFSSGRSCHRIGD